MYLPVITCGNENVSVSGIAIYSGDRLVKILKDDKEIQGLLFLKDKIKSGMIMVEHTVFGKTAVEITKSRSKAKVYYENGKVIIEESIKVDVKLNEAEKGLDIQITDKELSEIKKLTEEEIAKICKKAFAECQNTESDCIRAGENLAMRNPKAYEKLCGNWHEAFKNAELKTNIECKISKINENSKKG